MNLKLFFSPVDAQIFETIDDQSSFFNGIRVSSDTMPDVKDIDIAIIGLTETRGGEGEGLAKAADEIRKKLYRLKKGNRPCKIVDLGNMNNGMDLEETQNRLREVCEMLIDNNILPLIIGGSHDLDYGQFRAYEGMKKLVSILNVDAKLDMNEKSSNENNKHIHKMLLHEPNFLFNYSHLAYQSYLIDPAHVALLERLYFEAYRLGHLREHIKEMEPIIRDADMMTFDISAIKSVDAPGSADPQAFGLTGEEACQICWYAGLNEKLSSVGFYEYNPDFDDDNKKTASVIATMLWYFVEGFSNRKSELDFKTNDYMKYVVSMSSEPETIIFYKSKLSEKWWLEVPHPDHSKYDRNSIVPCNYSDYEEATKGNIPERWINTYSKLI